MNYLKKKTKRKTVEKVIRRAVVALAGLGFFLIVGAVGHSDYTAEIGQYYPFYKTAVKMLIGSAMLVPAWLIYKDEEH